MRFSPAHGHIVSLLLAVMGCADTTTLELDHSAPSELPTSFAVLEGYEVVALPTDERQSWATDINAHHQIVGYMEHSVGFRPFIWSPTEGMRHLGSLRGGFTTAEAVNDAGHVAGRSDDGNPRAYFWSNETGMIDIGTLGGIFALANGINNNDAVVGRAAYREFETHAFVWTRAGGMRDLTPTLAVRSEAFDINDRGEIVGSVDDRAAYWSATGELTYLTESWGTANGINNNGVVVGWYMVAPDNFIHAFKWTRAGGFIDLTPSSVSASALDVSNDGYIGGNHNNDAVVWDPSGAEFTLTSLGVPTNAAFLLGIGSGGVAVGSSYWNGYGVAAYWKPIAATTPAAQLSNLQSAITQLVASGALSTADSRGVTNILGQAGRSIEAGNRNAARAQLEAFIRQIEAMVLAGRLSRANADALVAAANQLIASL